MPESNVCRFCRIPFGQAWLGPVDVPFFQNDIYFTIASIGALIEGWSLIVPKEHVLSLREHYSKPDFAHFRKLVVDRIQSVYGPTVMFEHGPNHCGSQTGCGTDHAHLHVVPATFAVSSMLNEAGVSAWQRLRASEILDEADGGEYLFFSTSPSDDDPIGFFQKVENPSSQFFRKAIASALGASAVADYKQHPHIDCSLRTRERLALTA